jgi:hypothetical protein
VKISSKSVHKFVSYKRTRDGYKFEKIIYNFKLNPKCGVWGEQNRSKNPSSRKVVNDLCIKN